MVEREIRPLQTAEVGLVSVALRHPIVVRDRLARQRSGQCVYLIDWEAGRPAGQALLHWRRPTAVSASPWLDAMPYLEDLFVLPAERRRGVGTSLLAAAASAAADRGMPGISLAVEVGNIGARRLYSRVGYVGAGIPPRRQLCAEHGMGGLTRTSEETVLDLVRWSDAAQPGAGRPGIPDRASAREAAAQPGAQWTGKLTDRAMKQSS